MPGGVLKVSSGSTANFFFSKTFGREQDVAHAAGSKENSLESMSFNPLEFRIRSRSVW